MKQSEKQGVRFIVSIACVTLGLFNGWHVLAYFGFYLFGLYLGRSRVDTTN